MNEEWVEIRPWLEPGTLTPAGCNGLSCRSNGQTFSVHRPQYDRVQGGLPRGPLHRAAAEDVDVQVGDGLAAILAVIDDDAKPRLVETILPGQGGGSQEQMS